MSTITLTKDVEAEIEASIYCECDRDLYAKTDSAGDIIVEPCGSCLDNARDEGRAEER